MTDLILCFIAMILVGIFMVLISLGNRIVEYIDRKEGEEVRRMQDDVV